MKIPAGTKFNVAVPIEITIPHEVDIDVLSEVLAASIRSLETNVRGGYYHYKFDCEWVTEDFVKRVIMASLKENSNGTT